MNQNLIQLGLKYFEVLKPNWLEKMNILAYKFYPNYMEELKGLAKGAEVNLEDILKLNWLASMELESCSTLILKSNDEIILVHNEDMIHDTGKYSYICDIETQDGINIIGFCYPGSLPGNAFGFNSKGIVFSGNDVPHPDQKPGLPRILNDRALCEAESIEQVLSIILNKERNAGFNHNILSQKEFRAINVEYTSNRSNISEIEQKFFHTNHYISPIFKDVHIPTLEENSTTEIRYKRGIELLEKVQLNSTSALKLISDDQIFREGTKANIPNIGEITGGTLCTAYFKVTNNDIEMEIFPPKKQKKEVIHFFKFKI
jgi:predicted choloylglycine hydrolase